MDSKTLTKIAVDSWEESRRPTLLVGPDDYIRGFIACWHWLTGRNRIKGLSFGLFPQSAEAIQVNPTVNAAYKILAAGANPVEVLDAIFLRYAVLEKETNELREWKALRDPQPFIRPTPPPTKKG